MKNNTYGDGAAPTVTNLTLQSLLATACARHPDTPALLDPPNRASTIGGEPRRLSWAETERAVAALAGLFSRLGLAPGSVIALHLPNTFEAIVTTLAVMRAGFVAAPLPLLWREADIVAALLQVGARVIIAGGRAGDCDHVALATRVAARVFSIRYVCSFGNAVDGVLPLDGVLTGDGTPSEPSIHEAGQPALLAWDVTPDGIVPLIRDHAQMIAAGRMVQYAAALPDGGRLLSGHSLASLAGVATGLVAWLLTGGTLALHLPFEPDVLSGQLAEAPNTTLVLPAALLPLADEAGLFSAGARRVLALWHAPERLATATPWPHATIALTDVLVFGETAILAATRGDDDGLPARFTAGPQRTADGVQLVDVRRNPAGALSFGGAIVPRRFRLPHVPADVSEDDDGAMSSGVAARIIDGGLTVTAPPAGIVGIGAYRMRLSDVSRLAVESGATIEPLPDLLAGHRLAAQAADPDVARDRLASAHALAANALRRRHPPEAERQH